MQASQLPALIPLPWANSGTKNAIPTASQVGIVDGKASLTTGFPPLTFTPLAAGGVAPDGADFNGILNLITQFLQWQSAGGQIQYDANQSAAIGGYPRGAVVQASDGRMWRSRVDNNTVVPGGAGWVSAYGVQQSGPLVVSLSRSLTAAEAVGNMILINGNTTSIALALPARNTCDDGAIISFLNASNFTVTLNAASGDAINVALSAMPNVVLQPGDSLMLALSVGGGVREAMGGSAQLAYTPIFNAQLTPIGFQKFPSRLIIQWGTLTTDASGTGSALYAIAFPNGTLSVTGSAINSLGTISISFYNGSLTGITAKATINGTNASTGIYYIAIGF